MNTSQRIDTPVKIDVCGGAGWMLVAHYANGAQVVLAEPQSDRAVRRTLQRYAEEFGLNVRLLAKGEGVEYLVADGGAA